MSVTTITAHSQANAVAVYPIAGTVNDGKVVAVGNSLSPYNLAVARYPGSATTAAAAPLTAGDVVAPAPLAPAGASALPRPAAASVRSGAKRRRAWSRH